MEKKPSLCVLGDMEGEEPEILEGIYSSTYFQKCHCLDLLAL